MTDDLVQGIYSRNTKKFYYLETGVAAHRNTIDRLRNVLIKRGIMTVDTAKFSIVDDIEILTIREAKLREMDFESIPLTLHVAKVAQEEAKDSTGGLFKS